MANATIIITVLPQYIFAIATFQIPYTIYLSQIISTSHSKKWVGFHNWKILCIISDQCFWHSDFACTSHVHTILMYFISFQPIYLYYAGVYSLWGLSHSRALIHIFISITGTLWQLCLTPLTHFTVEWCIVIIIQWLKPTLCYANTVSRSISSIISECQLYMLRPRLHAIWKVPSTIKIQKLCQHLFGQYSSCGVKYQHKMNLTCVLSQCDH